MLKVFQKVGQQLLSLGLITSHGGNASVRRGDKIFITRHASMLGCLEKGDIIRLGLNETGPIIKKASFELPVHREIYLNSEAGAVLHAHPPHAIALSLVEKDIRPRDAEGAILLREVPVIETTDVVGSKEVGLTAAGLLKEYKIVMVKGHGSFAVGETLEEALCYTSTLEDSARIIFLLKGLEPK
ncbi:MAG TPA: class II aldolase/adducin family protein [Candidatus Hypogeohydataceae bacterium YC41]